MSWDLLWGRNEIMREKLYAAAVLSELAVGWDFLLLVAASPLLSLF